MKLLCNALIKFFCGFVMVGALIFLPAGTLRYGCGWLLMGILFLPMLIAGFVMLYKSPAFLEKRLDAKEKQSTQKGVLALSALMFIGGFLVAGLDFRFGWSQMPTWVTIAATALFLLSYLLYAQVMRQNAYLSRTIRVEEGQTVVDTGLYGIVRHPMYTATLLMFLSIPVMLGSWWALIVFAVYPGVIIMRLLNEEKLLAAELTGYADYMNRVKYRLIPSVW